MLIIHAPNISVSEVNYSDLPCLAEISQIAGASHASSAVLPRYLIDATDCKHTTSLLIDKWQNNVFDTFIKATDKKGDILGYLAASELNDPEKQTSKILQFYTLPLPLDAKIERYQTPGSKLMRHYLYDMYCMEINEIVLSSTSYAQPYYEHYGFKPCQTYGMRLNLKEHPEYKNKYLAYNNELV